MCRIAGIFYTDDSKAHEEWTPTETAQLLFPAMRYGGPHAFGWMTYDGEQIEHAKYEGDVSKIANLDKVQVNDDAKWMVLHTRYATHGNTENAHNNHPIEHGDVIGVHNGILSNHEVVLAEVGGRQYPDASVDSEAIFAAIDTWGHAPGLRKIEGDMATVYAKYSKPETLYFAKSHGRPLVFARTKAGSLVFASEERILHDVFGHDLTDVRSLQERQLVRAVNGKVVEARQWAPEPVIVSRPPRQRYQNGRALPRPDRYIPPQSGKLPVSGLTDWFDPVNKARRDEVERSRNAYPQQPTTKPKAAAAGKRLSKKQKANVRRRELARQEALRAASPEGLHYYEGMLVTAEELAWLEGEADTWESAS